MLPAFIFLLSFRCAVPAAKAVAGAVTHLYVRFATHQTSPSNSLSKGEGAVLHIFNQLYDYHIILIFLFNTFEDADYKGIFVRR